MHPFGEYAAKTLGYKKVAIVSLDYAFGWETAGGFHKSFEDNGGQIIQRIWVPLNVQDYAPYLAQIRRDADAVFVVALGRWTVLFSKQYADSGLKARIPLIAGGTYSDEHVLPQLGDEAIGVISAHHYSASLDTPANRRSAPPSRRPTRAPVLLLGELLHRRPGHRAEAVKAVGGKVEDRAALMAALRRVAISDAPRGPVKMDPYGNPTQNIYIRKVEKVDGELQNTVIHTYPGGQPVLDVRPRGVPRAAGVLAGVSALHALLRTTRIHTLTRRGEARQGLRVSYVGQRLKRREDERLLQGRAPTSPTSGAPIRCTSRWCAARTPTRASWPSTWPRRAPAPASSTSSPSTTCRSWPAPSPCGWPSAGRCVAICSARWPTTRSATSASRWPPSWPTTATGPRTPLAASR